ncbi:hypothetical protein ACFHWD_20195 [Clostridium sp. MT-14]|jgi:plasmid segregation protein ParM|uniref:ParM/StbA family protein n=1 Tax=Clostridium aromativorans TaxID=2836848 RepID=A0ABS8NB01_9CLOT|nr:ParM/StbA family protein [Clostridium aromativorans]MCC9296836.1 ParM/StbA family protein [Clostridium aromativorans]CAB1249487.1 ALP_N domain-containing protein [Clostridiaceae bacterium BL-3]
MYKIGLDLGYKYTKGVADNGKKVCFPSVIAQDKSAEVDDDIRKFFSNQTGNSGIENNLYITISNGKYKEKFKVGNAAINERNVRSTFLDNKCNSIENKICLAAASSILLPEKEGDIFLVSGLPISSFSQQKDIFKNMLLNYDLTVEVPKYNIKKHIKFQRVELVPQGLAAIYAAVWENIKKYSIPGSYIGLIDWGGKTVDYAVFRIDDNGFPQYVPEFSGTIDGGMFQIENDVSTLFKEKYGTELIYSSLLRLIETGKIYFNRQQLDFSRDIEDIKKDRAEKVLNEITKKWTDIIAYFNTVFASGGGSIDMYDYLKAVSEVLKLELAKDSQMGNALGYHKIAELAEVKSKAGH